jgi:spore maturation protein B
MTEGLKTHGPDSLIGNMLSTMMGSTETTFYVLAVYFGSVAVRKTRHALPAALLGDFAGLAMAIFVCNLVFG